MKITPLLAASASLNLALAIGAVGLILDRFAEPAPSRHLETATPEVSRTASPDAHPATFAANSPSVPLPGTPLPTVTTLPPAATSVPTFAAAPAASVVPATSGPSLPADGTPSDPALGRKQVLNPAAPGNSLHFRGVRVALAEVYQSPTAGRAFGIDVTAAPSTDPGAETPDSSEAAAAANLSLDSPLSGTPEITTASRLAKASQDGGTAPLASNEITPPAALPVPESEAKEDGFGFTREEELFRAKWGWEAANAAQMAAAREAGSLKP